MLVAIHQPEHLPWLGFFHKMKSADLFVFLDDVQYRKNYFQNRNRILTPGGPQWVTVPVELHGHTARTLCDTRIDNRHDWRRKYWGSIAQNYSRHAYFHEYGPPLERVIMEPWEELVPLNLRLIELLRPSLQIDTPCITASSLQVGAVSSPTEHLLRICQAVGATAYLSGQFGRQYLDQEMFRQHAVAVYFHEFTHPVYPQRTSAGFVSDLSAFDLLCNSGPEGGRLLLPQSLVGPGQLSATPR